MDGAERERPAKKSRARRPTKTVTAYLRRAIALQKLPKIQVPQEGFWHAHVLCPSDRIDFEPAVALSYLRPETAIGLLKGHGGQELCVIAKTC